MANLPGIQAIPNGVSPELRTFLRQIRERALATDNQFTDAEAAALRRLLNTSTDTNTPVVTATKQIKTSFFTTPYKLYEGQGTATWTKCKGSDVNIPDGATAVVIETRWLLYGKVGGDLRHACMRIDSSKGNGASPFDDTFILTAGQGGRDSNIDASSGFNQGAYPLDNATSFEYLTNSAGFGWTNLLIRIIGYQAEVS